MNRSILALAAIALLTLSAGCGQSGPLYLPGNPSKIQSPPQVPADAEEEREDDEDDESSQN